MISIISFGSIRFLVGFALDNPEKKVDEENNGC